LLSIQEVEQTPDSARGQSLAEAKVMTERWQGRMTCSSLAIELCTGVSQRAVVSSCVHNMVEEVWLELQARETWGVMFENPDIQRRVLIMMEGQGKALAEMEKNQRHLE
jgi:hypothetical protein